MEVPCNQHDGFNRACNDCAAMTYGDEAVAAAIRIEEVVTRNVTKSLRAMFPDREVKPVQIIGGVPMFAKIISEEVSQP